MENKEKKVLTPKEVLENKIKQEISQDIKKGFLNPFKAGVNYSIFLEAVGKKSVAEYCKNNLTKEQIEWLENDLKKYKTNKK